VKFLKKGDHRTRKA